MKSTNKSLIYSGVTTYCSSYHFTDNPRINKRIPETLVAQVGNLLTKEESYYFIETNTNNMLYLFIPNEQSDITYILISPQKENEKELIYLIDISRKLIHMNGMTDLNMKNISTRRNILENYYRLYDSTPMYLRMPTMIPSFEYIVSNYIYPNYFSDGVKSMDGFGFCIGGFFRQLLPGKKVLSTEENTCLTVWANTILKTYLADAEIKEEEYIANETSNSSNLTNEVNQSNETNKTEIVIDGNSKTIQNTTPRNTALFVPYTQVEEYEKELKTEPVQFTIKTATQDWILAVQRITHDMLIVGYQFKGEIVMPEFANVVKKIYPVMMMLKRN